MSSRRFQWPGRHEPSKGLRFLAPWLLSRDGEWREAPSLLLRVCSGLSAAVLLCPPLLHAAPSSISASVVSTENQTATQEAAQVLREGGSAADAAVVAALVAGVASPTSSGIGGGGFAVGWDAKSRKPYVLDFRETAPQAAERDPFERRPLEQSEVGHLSGTPGEIRGLFELHRRAGRLRWGDLVRRAENRAKLGFPVSRHLGEMLTYAQAKLQKIPSFSALYYPGGKPALVGARLTNPKLAATLARIAQEGPSAFYTGSIAEDLVRASQAHGGKLSLSDLENYAVKERTPLRVSYEGHEIITMPPPSAGGLMMVQTLKMFSGDYLRRLGHGTPAYQHVIAEALRGAVADRMRYLGDPDFEKIKLEELLSDERLAQRRESIALDRTHSLPRFGLEEKGTHALVTADREGNVISLTTTINHLFGAKIMAEMSGIVLNNELDDFGSKEQVAPFGMSETPNPLRPGARPVSSMTPTIVTKDSQPVLALGGSGGTAIATNVTQVLLAALVFGHDPKKAVSADRIYIPSGGLHMLVEKGTQKAHIEDLRRRGELVGTMPFTGTAVQMLRFDEKGARAAADPRKHGTALVNGQ